MRRTHRVIKTVAFAVAVLLGSAGLARAQTLVGDADGDGFVGALDLQIVIDHWNQVVTVGDTSVGDFVPDGFISFPDLNALMTNWGEGSIPTPGGSASIGMNLNEVTYYTREWVFVNVVNNARPWVMSNPNGQPFDTGQPVPTDANGWPNLQPGQAAQTLLLTDKPGGYPTGTYQVEFDGTGSIAFQFDATNVQSTGPGTMSFDINNATKNGVLMRIIANNAGDHITNVRVWMPGTQGQTSPFEQGHFIERLRPFGVIRFMDWQQTNGSNVVEWADRNTPDHFTQDSDNGVALEYMIELCNELGADAWFCMPHLASDDYVTQFATMVRDNLDPSLHVYVEWSNEVWNTQFGQSKWVEQNSDGGYFSDAFFQKWAGEALNDFAIWETVFAGQEDRVIRVAAGQEANVWVTRRLTEEMANLYTGTGTPYDAIACGAYFDGRHTPFDASTTVQDILDNATNVTIPNVMAREYKDHGDLAQQRSNELGKTIPLLAYEGGQHYTVNGIASLPYYQAFLDVQEDPGMYDAYTANLQAFDQAGGSLFMGFNYVRNQDQYGSWGHLIFQNQDISGTGAPKYRALIDYGQQQQTQQVQDEQQPQDQQDQQSQEQPTTQQTQQQTQQPSQTQSQQQQQERQQQQQSYPPGHPLRRGQPWQ